MIDPLVNPRQSLAPEAFLNGPEIDPNFSGLGGTDDSWIFFTPETAC